MYLKKNWGINITWWDMVDSMSIWIMNDVNEWFYEMKSTLRLRHFILEMWNQTDKGENTNWHRTKKSANDVPINNKMLTIKYSIN